MRPPPETMPLVFPAIRQRAIRTVALTLLSDLTPLTFPLATQESRFRFEAPETETARNPAEALLAAVVFLAATVLLSSTRMPKKLLRSWVFSSRPFAVTLVPGLTWIPPLAAPLLLRMIELLTKSWLTLPAVALVGTNSMPIW